MATVTQPRPNPRPGTLTLPLPEEVLVGSWLDSLDTLMSNLIDTGHQAEAAAIARRRLGPQLRPAG